MASTESKIRLIFEGVERGVAAAAAKARAAVATLKDENDKVAKSFDTLDKGASRAGTALLSMGKAIAVLGAAGAAVNVIGGLAGSLAQLAPIALVLPGALLSAGAAFGTLAIAMSGFNDTIAAGLHGDLANFNKGLAAMPPEMRKAAQAVVAFKGDLNQIKTAVQGAFWSKFNGDITALGNNLLPTMKSGLRSIAGELGFMVKGAVQVASTPFFRGQVASILVSTRAAIENMRPALGNVLAGFVSMAKVGAEFMPRLGQSITEVTAKFKAWATSVEGQKQIKTFIENAIQGFKDLFGIIKNLGSIFASVFTGLGATMQSPLALLKELTGELAAFLKTAEAQEGLKALGEILQEAGTAIKEVFLAAMKQVLPIIKEWAPAIKAAIQGFKDFALDVINTVGPALRDLGKFLSENKDAIRTLIPIIASAVIAFKGFKVLTEVVGWAKGAHAALKTLAGILPGLGTGAGKAGTGLKGMVGPLKGIAGVVGLGIIAKEVDDFNIAAAGGDPSKLEGMAEQLHDFVEAGKQLAAGDFTGIFQDISDEIDQFNSQWGARTTPIQQFANDFVSIFDPIPLQVRERLEQTSGEFKKLPPDIGASLNELGTVIQNTANSAMVKLDTEVKAGFDRTREIVAAVPQSMFTALQPLTGLFGTTATTATNQFSANARQGFTAAEAATRVVPGLMNQALASLAGLLGGTATTSTNRFKSGAKAGFDAAVAATRPVPGQVNSALSPLAGQLGTTGATAGNTFNTRLSGALRAAAGAAAGATAGIARAISGELGKLGSIGAAAGAAVGAGLVRGLNSQRGAVAGAAAGLGATVRANKGPIEKDRKMLIPAGIALVQGLIAGMNAQMGSLAAFSSSIAPGIASSLAGGLGSVNLSAPSSTAGAVQSLASSLQARSAEPLQVRVFIGDRELTDLVRTEVDTNSRAVRRTVGAGAGTSF